MHSDPTSPTVDQPTADLTVVNQSTASKPNVGPLSVNQVTPSQPAKDQPTEDQPTEDQLSVNQPIEEQVAAPAAPSRTIRPVLLAGVLVALLLAAVVSFYASSSPDGLEKVAADKGIAPTAQTHHMADSPFAGYGTKGVSNSRLSTGLAGIAGVAVTLALGTGLALAVRRREPRSR